MPTISAQPARSARPKAAWVSQNPREAELIAQRRAGYGDEIRYQFITRKWQYRMLPVTDAGFVPGLQKGDRLAGGEQSAPGDQLPASG
jgi:hypothetical protein